MEKQPHDILIIEDNQDVLDAMINILEYSGYSSKGLIRFNDSIFEKVKKENFSLIILDVMLSGIDGRDLVKKFKDTPETKDIPVLMISAYPNVEYSVKMAGADAFIQKPFGIDDLIEEVDRYVKSNIKRT